MRRSLRSFIAAALIGLTTAGHAAFVPAPVPQGAFTTYTPTVTAPGATTQPTFSSTSGAYQITGKLACVRATTTISTVGAGASSVSITFPYTAVSANQYIGGAREAVGGESLKVIVNGSTNTFVIVKYDNSSPITAGAVLYVSGCFEVQ